MTAVLCYHRIGGPLELGITRVARSVFRRQMTALAQAGWRTMSLDEYASEVDAVRNHAPRTTHRFLLTFDDGYASLADFAYPVLGDLGFTATTFLVTDFVGRTNTWDVRYTWNRLPHLDWPTVEQWQARGMEFASHTTGHQRLTWLADGAARDQLARSRDVLVARLGGPASRAVAYPFGAVDDRVARLARDVGYTLGFGGVRGERADPLRQPRAPVYVWDVGSTPLGLRAGRVGAAARFVAHVANRCAVGTSWMLKMKPEQGAGSSR